MTALVVLNAVMFCFYTSVQKNKPLHHQTSETVCEESSSCHNTHQKTVIRESNWRLTY